MKDIILTEGNNELSVQMVPIAPPEDLMAALLTAMSEEDLTQLRAQFEQDYRDGKITTDQYMELHITYIRRSYFLDLYLRGEPWHHIADEYWQLTEGIIDSAQLYSIYVMSFESYYG